MVEAALRMQRDGDRPVDRVAWAETAAAADAYLSATMRSEQVHHQVRPAALKISDSYEIEVSYDPDPGPAAASAGTGRVYVIPERSMAATMRALGAKALGGLARVQRSVVVRGALPPPLLFDIIEASGRRKDAGDGGESSVTGP